MKQLWICNKDSFALNIGGGTVLQFSIQNTGGHVVFWGFKRGTSDFYQYPYFLKLFGFTLSWSIYNWKAKSKTWHFNRWRYKRERLTDALEWEQEGC